MSQRRNNMFVFGATMFFFWWLPRMVEWAIDGMEIAWDAWKK